MKILTTLFHMIRKTFSEWNEDGAPMLAAALAYYTAFSIAPLIVLIVAISGFVINQDDIQGRIIEEITVTMGEDVANLVSELVENTNKPAQGIISTILGLGALFLGALGVFNHLQKALDRIWDVDEVKRKSGVQGFLKDKLLSFGMLLIVGFLLLVSLVMSTLLSFVDGYLASLFPGADILLRLTSLVISLGITTLLFMLIFKILPHANIEWKDVGVGAFVTSVLFTIGRTILGLYIGNSAATSSYGAAGALVVLLLWVYYSAQIVLFGAEFTQVFARQYGSKIVPDQDVTPSSREKEIVEAGSIL